MKARWLAVLVGALTLGVADGAGKSIPYAIVDTNQDGFYGNRGLIGAAAEGTPFALQDAGYLGNAPSYRDNGDGTVSDLVTGLVWVKGRGEMMTWEDALAGASACRVGGHEDWRMPTIKELYSLIDFNGYHARTVEASRPYISTRYFEFRFGDESKGARLIDCQDWSATTYLGTTMGGNPTAFGVNFADGRIKGYPRTDPRGSKKLYVRYVRGNPSYGKNDFVDNGDSTVSDRATGLVWAKADSGRTMSWEDAFKWVAELNARKHLGHDDWRLPNAKELHSLVDYDRAPDAKDPAKRGPAIDPVFEISRHETGEHPFYWSSTTHIENLGAVYVAFGRALGYMNGKWIDVHGAGAQRSDPKTGSAAQYPRGFGPQGDEIRILNFVRPVRGGTAVKVAPKDTVSVAPAMPANDGAVQPPAVTTAPGGLSRNVWITRLDRDGDGRVSRAEFDGPGQGFPRFDGNGDGFIDSTEAPTGPPK